jgi:hypothetical protein
LIDREEKKMTNAQSPIYLSEVKLKRLRSKGAVRPTSFYKGGLKAPASEYNDIRKVDSLDENELKSVCALVAYVAYNKRMDEDAVRDNVLQRFGVADIEHLRSQSYEEIIRFLVNLCVEEVLN